jgi:hypothetical protein
MSAGVYYTTLDATDSATVGPLTLFVHVAGALSCKVVCYVYEEAVFDALMAAGATGMLPANVTHFGGSAGTFVGGRPEIIVQDGGITAAKLAADTITAAKIAADAVNEIQNGLATAANLAMLNGYVDTEIATIIATLGTISGLIDTEIAAILAKVNALPVNPAATTDIPDTGDIANAVAAALAPSLAGLSTFDPAADAVKLAADGLTATKAESDTDLRQAISIILAYVTGKLSNAGSANPLIQNRAGTATRVAVTTDEDGNRTGITYTPYGG